MLINIIHKGSLPDSNSTTYPMGASLSDILFSFVLEKYIVCDVCGLRSPHLSLVVCYIFHLLIPLLCKTWFYKDCNRNCKIPVLDVIRTLGTSNQALYYNLLNIYFSSLIDVDTLNNNVTKGRCSIPMDTTVRLGPLQYSLRAPIDHHGPSIHSGDYTASINCCEKTFYCNDHTITEFGIIDSKNSPTAYVILYELIDTWFLGSNRRLEQEGGSLIAPMALAHPLHPIDNRSRNRRRNLWVGWCVSSWWPLFPSGSSVLIYMYICSSIWVLFSLVYQLCLALWW